MRRVNLLRRLPWQRVSSRWHSVPRPASPHTPHRAHVWRSSASPPQWRGETNRIAKKARELIFVLAIDNLISLDAEFRSASEYLSAEGHHFLRKGAAHFQQPHSASPGLAKYFRESSAMRALVSSSRIARPCGGNHAIAFVRRNRVPNFRLRYGGALGLGRQSFLIVMEQPGELLNENFLGRHILLRAPFRVSGAQFIGRYPA